jgi:hypothetical protein
MRSGTGSSSSALLSGTLESDSSQVSADFDEVILYLNLGLKPHARVKR